MKLSILAFAAVAYAQRPTNTSICDYYTTALLKNNTAANQYKLLQLLVNTAVIGNYTTPNKNKVPGILAAGKVNDTDVNLVPYFSGGLASSNRGGSKGVSVNFLDGGAADPIKKNMAADDEDSNQYKLLTHLYQYFGYLLECSKYGQSGFPRYQGNTNMYQVHKFMALDYAEVTYFIQQVGLSAASFGVSEDDVTAVGTALTNLFNYRCSPPVAIPSTASKALQAICIASDCPTATASATCGAYSKVVEPQSVTTSMTSSSGSGSGSASSSTTSGLANRAQVPLGLVGAALLGML